MDQPNYEWNIQALPPEVMMKIFEFLTVKERLTASLTCKTWYQLAFSPKFCREMCICFGRRNAAFKNIHAYQNYRKAFVFINDEPNVDQSTFFRAAPLESLVISGCIGGINTLLDAHLLAMNHLTALVVLVKNNSVVTKDVLRITHPSLKSVEIKGFLRDINLAVNCPSLIRLKILCSSEIDLEKVVQLVTQFQHQLQCLVIVIIRNDQLDRVANVLDKRLSNLKKLELLLEQCVSDGFRLSFNTMLNLVELCLSGDKHLVTVGEELGVLTKLSKLVLAVIAIDAKGFTKALVKTKELKDLGLDRCVFASPTQSLYIESEAVSNLFVGYLEQDRSVSLPHCTTIKSLKLIIHGKEIDDVFEQACNLYPQLEKLHLLVQKYTEFHSSISFSHIKKLPLLKELHLRGLSFTNLDWTECSGMNIEILRLYLCAMDVNEVRQLIKSVGPGLRQLFLDQCDMGLDTLPYVGTDEYCSLRVITENFVELLRKQLPQCRISCKFSFMIAKRGCQDGGFICELPVS